VITEKLNYLLLATLISLEESLLIRRYVRGPGRIGIGEFRVG
jgi:hypothetical protein